MPESFRVTDRELPENGAASDGRSEAKQRDRENPDVAAPSGGNPPTRLTEALENAELLVEFAARNGKGLPKELVRGVMKARATFNEGRLNGDDEAAFYAVYDGLTQKLDKITVGSIKDSREEFGQLSKRFVIFGSEKQYSRASLAVRSFKLAAMLALSLLIFVQIYWMWGTNLLESLNQARNTYLTVEAKEKVPVVREGYPVH